MENFKVIDEFPGYSISKSGIVINNKSGRCLKHIKDKGGYSVIGLRKDNKAYYRCVSRMVALTFIPNPDNKPQVNHKNGDKDNNNDWNLEWSTSLENIHHAINIGLRKHPDQGGVKRVPIQVFLAGTNELIAEYPSIRGAARSLAIHKNNIHNVLNGLCKESFGLTFKLI